MADSKIVKEARSKLAGYREGTLTPLELIGWVAANPTPLARLLGRSETETREALSALRARAAKAHPGSTPYAHDACNKAIADGIAAAPAAERKRRAEARAAQNNPSSGVVIVPLAEPGPDLSKQTDGALVSLLRASLQQPPRAALPANATPAPAPVAAVASVQPAAASTSPAPAVRVVQLPSHLLREVERLEQREARAAAPRARKDAGPRAPRAPRLQDSECPRCKDRARYMTEQRAYRKARDAAKAKGDAAALAAAMATMPKLRLPPAIPGCARCEARYGKKPAKIAPDASQVAA